MRLKSWQFGIGIIIMLLAMLLVWQLRTQFHMRKWLPSTHVTELAAMLKGQEDTRKRLEAEITSLRDQLHNYNRDAEIERLRMVAGLTDVEGSGIEIFLADKKDITKDEEPVFFIVHYDQLEGVVNELFAAGAEAVEVSGERIVSTTGFSCVGTTILVDTKRMAPPYIIKAIGDPETLKNALMIRGGYVEQQILQWGLQFDIAEKKTLKIKAYHGSMVFNYARNAKEGE